MDRQSQAVGGGELRNGLEDGFSMAGTEMSLILCLLLCLVRIGTMYQSHPKFETLRIQADSVREKKEEKSQP